MNRQPARLNHRRILFLLTAGVASMLASTAFAQITVSHNWEAEWNIYDSEGNPVSGSDSGSNSGGGQNSFSVSGLPSVISFMNGTSMLSVDAAAGQIRSSTNLHTYLDADSNEGFDSSFFQSINDVQFLDTLTVAADSGFIEIRIVAEGSFQHDLVVGGAAGLSTIRAESQVSATAFIGADFGQDLQIMDNTINGGLVDFEEWHETRDITMDFSVLFPFVDGEATDFFFQYQELATLDQDTLDADFAEGIINNRFGHTMTLYGRVFDTQMNLLEGVTVNSSNGFNYQTFSSVPEAGSAGILATMIGLVVRRRRRTRA